MGNQPKSNKNALTRVEGTRAISDRRFQHLADVPPEAEWFANIANPDTRRAYRNDIKQFFAFIEIKELIEVRQVTRAHCIAWRDQLKAHLKENGEPYSPRTINRKLSAGASLYDALCDKNAVPHNPFDGVARIPISNNVRSNSRDQ